MTISTRTHDRLGWFLPAAALCAFILAMLLAVLSIGCAGGASAAAPPVQPPSIAWSAPSYSADPGVTGTSVNATVTVLGGTAPLPGIVGISLDPSGNGAPVTCGNGPWQATSTQGVATFQVMIHVDPSAAKGTHALTATLMIGANSYTGKSTVFVQ